MAPIIRSSDVSVKDVVHDPIKQKGKGKISTMSFNGSKMIIQIPNTTIPFGLSTYVDKKEEDEEKREKDKRFSLELLLGGIEKIEAFRDQLIEFDKLNVNAIHKNQQRMDGESDG